MQTIEVEFPDYLTDSKSIVVGNIKYINIKYNIKIIEKNSA